jgi:biopolymer transport protein ExbD
MALIKKQSKASDKIPTSSMADIAFLLLIFFLVTTVFDQEQGLQVVLPEKADDIEVEVSPKNLIFFEVQTNGTVVVRRGESQQTQTITYRQVEGIMRQSLASNPNLIAAIMTHPSARYEDMTRVLDGVQSSGATRFSLQRLGAQ